MPGVVDFDDAGPGNCLIWYLSYDGDVTGLAAGLNANDLMGDCFALSNSILVERSIAAECSLITFSDIICSPNEGGGYNVLLTWQTSSANPQLTITDNNLGITFAPSNQSGGTASFGPFEEPNGYSYTITDASVAGCSSTESLMAVSCNVTAIELLEFDGRVLDNGNELSWTTASEEQNAYFTLERSEDGVNFEEIAKIESQGDANTRQDYNYLDEVPSQGAYYRLLDTDVTGETNIASDIVFLQRTSLSFELVSVSPIPTVDKVNVQLNTNQAEDISIQVYNAVGQMMIERVIYIDEGLNNFGVDLSNYANGMYFLNLVSKAQGAKQISIMKQN